MATLDKAILIAAQAHRYQRDKAGRPYILHPLRVMMAMDNEQEMTAAVLHDVVEDSKWTLERLRSEGFSAEIIDVIEALTRCEDESYEEYASRAGKHPVARKIKLADLHDNMDITRLVELNDESIQRLRQYHAAWQMLKQDDHTP